MTYAALEAVLISRAFVSSGDVTEKLRTYGKEPNSIPQLAQSRHAQCADECPLLGGKRTALLRAFTSASDRSAGTTRPKSN